MKRLNLETLQKATKVFIKHNIKSKEFFDGIYDAISLASRCDAIEIQEFRYEVSNILGFSTTYGKGLNEGLKYGR